MKLVITVTSDEQMDLLKEQIEEDEEMAKDLHIESQEKMKMTVQIDPSLFRAVNSLVKENKADFFKNCTVEVVDNDDEPEQMREVVEKKVEEEEELSHRKKGSKKEAKVAAYTMMESKHDSDSDEFDKVHFGNKNTKAKKSQKV